MSERHIREQLACVVEHYPLWPGDTLSHEAAKECARRGWIVRQRDGSWIPTAAGIREHGAKSTEERNRS